MSKVRLSERLLHNPSSSSSSAAESESEFHGQIGGKDVTQGVSVEREAFLTAHRDLSLERFQLRLKNNILHRRLAEHYKKKKMEHCLKPIENAADLEEKYQQQLFAFEELKEKNENEIADIKAKVIAVEENYNNQLEDVEKKFDELQNYEETTSIGLIYSQKGKPIADKTVHRFLTLQRRKQEQASALCLRYIRARNAVADLDNITRKLERIAPGLYVAHYQELVTDNRNFRAKIEEREDELIKNRNKCNEYQQILGHIREKMHHTDEIIDITEGDLGDAELKYQKAREELGEVKTRRDRLRFSLEDEKIKAGLLTRKELLRDYQDAIEQLKKVKERKAHLLRQIQHNSESLRTVRVLAEQASLAATSTGICSAFPQTQKVENMEDNTFKTF